MSYSGYRYGREGRAQQEAPNQQSPTRNYQYQGGGYGTGAYGSGNYSPTGAAAGGSYQQRTSDFAASSSFHQPWGNVRFCAVGRLNSRSIVASHIGYNSISQDKYNEVAQALLGSQKVEEYSRHTFSVDDRGSCTSCRCQCSALKDVGALHFDATANGWVFMVITAPGFSQRLAYRLLDDFKVQFETSEGLHSYTRDAEKNISRQVQQWLPALSSRYDKMEANSVKDLTAAMDAMGCR